MSTGLLFTFGAAIFICTSLGTLMYGYTVLRRNYTVALGNVGAAPALYVRPDTDFSGESDILRTSPIL
jgi:hypothetical protein